MRKLLFAIAAIVASLTFNSCQPTVSGEFSYFVVPSEENIPGSSLTWQLDPLGQKLVEQELDKVGTNFRTVWNVSGYKKDCDKLVKNAVDNAVSLAENDPEYNKLFDLSGITIVVYCLTDNEGNTGGIDEKFEIHRRTYSKNK